MKVGLKFIRINGKSVTRMTKSAVVAIIRTSPKNAESATEYEFVFREDAAGAAAYGITSE